MTPADLGYVALVFLAWGLGFAVGRATATPRIVETVRYIEPPQPLPHGYPTTLAQHGPIITRSLSPSLGKSTLIEPDDPQGPDIKGDGWGVP